MSLSHRVPALLLLLALASNAAGVEPDFARANAELTNILQGFVRVDTSNPPGNETRGARYLKSFLDAEGIASEIFELESGRGNLVARLRGNGKKRPLMLIGHLDVVGVEREKWTVDPFAGTMRDGYLYGRGALDDKAMTAANLEVFLLLHRLRPALERDIILVAEAGEEGTTQAGIDFLVDKHWDKIDCEFALNEGGGIREVKGRIHSVGISTTEKVPRPIVLSAKGNSGHGSRPRLDNAITHLAAAVAKVGNWQPPMRLNETTRASFAKLATVSPAEEAFLFSHLEDPALSELVQEKIRVHYPSHNAILRTTVVPTMIKGGFRVNVIPGDATATLDVRALPDEDMDKFIAALRAVIDDPAIEVTRAGGSRPATAPSRLDTDLFHALERAQRHLFPEAITLPRMQAGATDSAQLRAKGVQAYGIGTVATDDDGSRVHGNDERVSLAGLEKFLRFTWEAIADVAFSHEQ